MPIRKFLRKRKIATLAELQESTGISRRTILRRLKEVGYRSSYTHNSQYYTLRQTPKFDRNFTWVCKGVAFTKLNNLVDLIVHCVDRSLSGYTSDELPPIVHTRVANQLRILARGRRLRRVRFSGGYVYFSLDANRYRRQLVRREKACGKALGTEAALTADAILPGALGHDEVVAILTWMINEPRYSIARLSEAVKKKGFDVSPQAIDELVEAYGLKRYKKKDINFYRSS